MKTESLSVKTTEGDFAAYVARPDAPKAPAVVVLQEIFGVNQVMRDVCAFYADQGYIAVCPDLFWRVEPGVDITDKSKAEWDKAFSLMNAFDIDQGMKDVQAVIDLIRADPQCSGKVGAVGFCLGGQLAYLAATRTDSDASVGFYGVMLDKRLGEAGQIKKPLMLHIAEKDAFVPPEAQSQIKAGLADNPLVQIHSYPERDHAFCRKGGDHFHAGDCAAAEARTLALFKSALG
jgi:carboxymethylenebutenolidase